MSITAIVENGAIKLPEGVYMPDGTKVEINLPGGADVSPKGANAFGWMMKYAGIVDDLPPDLGAEHDHYLNGAPKRRSEVK